MVTYNTVVTHSEENLRYIGEHKRAFDIEYLYPIDIFEDFVQKQKWGCGIYCCCNIDRDRLYPARFDLSFDRILLDKGHLQHDFKAALSFLHRVEERPGVKLDYHLLQQFIGAGLDPNRFKWINVGVDAQTQLNDSRLKLYITIENYPEKEATAIALCGENRDWAKLLVSHQLLIGFDFFLDGRTDIELYPTFGPEDLQRADVQTYLRSILPARALPLLDKCPSFQMGISKSNESDALYFNHPIDPNDFVDNLGNEMAKKVHGYYRNQPVKELLVGIPASEFLANSLRKVKMYYRMTEFRYKQAIT